MYRYLSSLSTPINCTSGTRHLILQKLVFLMTCSARIGGDGAVDFLESVHRARDLRGFTCGNARLLRTEQPMEASVPTVRPLAPLPTVRRLQSRPATNLDKTQLTIPQAFYEIIFNLLLRSTRGIPLCVPVHTSTLGGDISGYNQRTVGVKSGNSIIPLTCTLVISTSSVSTRNLYGLQHWNSHAARAY